MKGYKATFWPEFLHFPLGGRNGKPRSQGLTMVIDKGMGLGETKDLLIIAGRYIDFLKLGFGTSALYTKEVLEEKIQLVRSHNIDIYPGGTFLEVAVSQNKIKEYLHMAKNLGYTAIEVSDGTVKMTEKTRAETIVAAAEMGFKILTEVGKKDPRDNLSVECLLTQIKNDLKNGADWVIIEGRESGKGVGIYDASGKFIHSALEKIILSVDDPNRLIWEAPLKHQQQDLILRLGSNVNLGNIAPREILSLEALRVGLRGDTFRTVCEVE